MLAMQEYIDKIESRINELENQMVQYDNDVVTTIDEKIDEKLAELNLGPKATDPPAESSQDTPEVMSQTMQLLQANVDSVGKDIEDLVLEVAAIITRTDETNTVVVALKAENEAMTKQIAVVSFCVHTRDSARAYMSLHSSRSNRSFTARRSRVRKRNWTR